jgi:protein-S-isoprenylcysteine O-methyltransferase Ste14
MRRVLQVLASALLLAVLLFLSAGRLDWRWAWLLMAMWLGGILVNALTVGRKHPEVIRERGRRPADQKRWDRILMALNAPTSISIPVVAGLDAVRFGWSTMGIGLHLAGAVLVALALFATWWSMMSNPFLSTVARIQKERDHRVATTGPYRYARHPMYAGMILLGLGVPLILGSWWALVPGVLTGIIFVVRTALEDQMLRAELSGYVEYADRVRYRLLPGVW